MTDAATVIPFKPRAAPPAPEEAFDTLDLRESLRILRRRAPLIGALVVAGIAWALLALLFITPQYRAETIVMLNARQTHVVDIGAVMSGLPVDNATLRSEIDIIGSRAVIDRVIDKLHLAEDPEFNRASWFAWLSSRTPQEQAERRRSETAREIGARLHVDNDGRSFSIRISSTRATPKRPRASPTPSPTNIWSISSRPNMKPPRAPTAGSAKGSKRSSARSKFPKKRSRISARKPI